MDVRAALEKASADIESAAPAETTPVETSAPAPVESAPAPSPKSEAAMARARAEDGKFAREPKAKTTIPPPAAKEATEAAADSNGASPAKTGAQGKEAAADSPPAAASTPASETYTDHKGRTVDLRKPPISAPAQVRETWGTIPREIREFIVKREHFTSEAVGAARQNKEISDKVHAALSPYESMARANGMDAVQYAGTVMQTAAALQMGSPAQKAAVVAQILQSYGVDVEMVNAHLQGQPVREAAPQRPQMDPREEIRRVLHEEAQQAAVAKASQALQTFVDSQPEFLDQVWDDMQAILEAGAKSTNPKLRNMTFEEAYARACAVNPEISQVMEQRKATQAVRTPQRATEQTRAAASSVRSQPAAAPAVKAKGIRGAMEAAAKDIGW